MHIRLSAGQVSDQAKYYASFQNNGGKIHMQQQWLGKKAEFPFFFILNLNCVELCISLTWRFLPFYQTWQWGEGKIIVRSLWNSSEISYKLARPKDKNTTPKTMIACLAWPDISQFWSLKIHRLTNIMQPKNGCRGPKLSRYSVGLEECTHFRKEWRKNE